MKKRMILLMVVMSLVATGCGFSLKEVENVIEVTTESGAVENILTEVEEATEEVQEEEMTEVPLTEKKAKEEEDVVEVEYEEAVKEEIESLITEGEPEVVISDQQEIPTSTKQEIVYEEPVLPNADHPFFEVFLVEHCFEDDGEYYYWGFYMPYGCDTDNCPEYDKAYYELICKMKGEKTYVFYGLDGEFADLGEYSFVRIGYRVPTEYMPETLTVHYEENVHWGKPGYIVYYTAEEDGSDKWWEVYLEFEEKYVTYDSEGRVNRYHDTRYFVDGEVSCYYVYE